MKAFLEIKKIELEDIITTSTTASDGLTNGGAGNAGDTNSGNWDEAETVTLLD